MAQNFTILDWKENHGFNRYSAKIRFNESVGDYEIRFSGAKVRYLDWIDMLMISDGFDCPFNGELPGVYVRGMSPEARKNEKGLESSFYEFIKTECSEVFENKILKRKID